MNLQTFQPGIYKRMQKKEQAIRSEFCHDRKESKPTYNIKKWTLTKGSLNLAEPLFCLQLSQAKSWAFMQCEIFSHGWCKTLFHFYIKCNALIPSSPPRRNYWGCYKINTIIHITWYLTEQLLIGYFSFHHSAKDRIQSILAYLTANSDSSTLKKENWTHSDSTAVL